MLMGDKQHVTLQTLLIMFIHYLSLMKDSSPPMASTCVHMESGEAEQGHPYTEHSHVCL